MKIIVDSAKLHSYTKEKKDFLLMDVFIGRQPIFNSKEEIFGYELLYRNGKSNAFPEVDADQATIEVLNHALLTIGMDELSSKRPCFINFTESLLYRDVFTSLNPEEVMVEVLENIPVTIGLISRLKELKEMGFKIALDDFVMTEELNYFSELFNIVTYIKVDFLHTTPEERWTIENIAKQHPHIKLLAEKIESREEFETAKAAGYSLFQGYFLQKPEIVQGTDIPPAMIPYIRLVNLLNQPDPDIEKITSFIEHDLSLSFKLLKLVNSPANGLRKEVKSIKQALVMLGLKELKKWLYVIALRDSIENKARTNSLIEISMVRAKLCELIAKSTGRKNAEEYFLVGMFSMIGVILNRPMESILSALPLSKSVSDTILGKETEMTQYFRLATAVEQMEVGLIDELTNQLRISNGRLQQAYNDAQLWALQLK
ncbi:EAL and HDOD domain-containing protein [Chungangia koreensis]|uniref:EAL and HDOD domain-containing protein n=1 Tax=Chungangia koreensis TaxID=752657 RepID=A0ABV8X7E7_9LACT